MTNFAVSMTFMVFEHDFYALVKLNFVFNVLIICHFQSTFYRKPDKTCLFEKKF